MALTNVLFGLIGGKDEVKIPAMVVRNMQSENITPTASTQSTAMTTSNGQGVRIVTDTAIYVSIGAAPNAETDTGRFYMMAESAEYWLAEDGDKVAVVTA